MCRELNILLTIDIPEITQCVPAIIFSHSNVNPDTGLLIKMRSYCKCFSPACISYESMFNREPSGEWVEPSYFFSAYIL